MITYLFSGVIALILLANSINTSGANVRFDDRGITEVAVNASQHASFDGGDPRDSDMALIHVIAVSAGAVELSEVVRSESLDVDRAF